MAHRKSGSQSRSHGRIHIGVSKTAVLNDMQSFELLREVGPRMCILTASHPGFLGYQAHRQVGVVPAAGRYGGASIDMASELNPVRLYQYTAWTSIEDHVAFHEDNFARFFELCSYCQAVTVEGPKECMYEVVWAELGQPMPERCVVISELQVKEGCEQAFADGMHEIEQALASAMPGYLGSMLLKGVGINPWGSLMLDPDSMVQMLTTLGANPPPNPQPLFEIRESRPTPPRYLVHCEWESAYLAERGFLALMTDFELRKQYEENVLRYLVYCGPEQVFEIMGEEPGWRRYLRQQ